MNTSSQTELHVLCTHTKAKVTAGNEKIVNNIVNREVYDRLNAPNKKLVHYPEAWHDLMFDEAIDKMADDLLAYLNTCVLHVKPNL